MVVDLAASRQRLETRRLAAGAVRRLPVTAADRFRGAGSAAAPRGSWSWAPTCFTVQGARAGVDLLKLDVEGEEHALLAAHLAAAELHEQAAELQERMGHPQRAAEARARAERARQWHRLAKEELAEYQARLEGTAGPAGRLAA
jgi:hypothetical protein